MTLFAGQQGCKEKMEVPRLHEENEKIQETIAWAYENQDKLTEEENWKNSGFILNSVHSTEGCYNYVKEIKAGICDLDLSKEEKDALFQAMKKSP